MPKNIKIVSVLTFSILTLQLQLHANEISKGPNNPKKKEFSTFNADQSKIKYATFAENNSIVKENGKLYPDYKAETLEDFLREYSVDGVFGNGFSRFLNRIPAYRKRRCPLRKHQHYPNGIKAKNEKVRKVRLIQQSSSQRNDKLTAACPWDKQCIDESGLEEANNINSKKYNFKTATSNILFPSLKVKSKLPFSNYSDSLVITTSECKIDSTRSPFDKASMKSMIEYDNYLNKGRKDPVPNLLPIVQTMYANKTKYFYDPYKSTKAVSKADRLPGESYLFDTTTSNIFRVKGASLDNVISDDHSLRIVKGNSKNAMEYFNENKEKAQSKNQQEAVFVSEKDYIVHEADRRIPDASKHLKHEGRNPLMNNQNIISRNSNFNTSKIKRDICVPRAEKFQQGMIALEKFNCDKMSGDMNNITTDSIQSTSGIGHHPEIESGLMKNLQKELSLHKREALEESHSQERSDLLSNVYDDYDYYFIIGDNNTDESPFQNDYRVMNVRTTKNLVGKFELNNEKASRKLENSKKLIHNKKHQPTFIEKTNSTINNTIVNNTVSTFSPNIIQKLWPNVGKEKLCLQDGKNYILNLFRRKGNYSKKNNLTSSTPQTPISNFFFRKRSKGNELGENGRKALSKEDKAYDKSYRKYIRNVKPTVELLNNHSSIFQSTKDGYNFNNIKDIFEISHNLKRRKRKSVAGNKAIPNKNLRRSVLNSDDDYNTKFQNLQKDLLELQKAFSAPRAARPARNEEKNLTLQIRVIVDVVNNSLGPTENPEDEQLKKRDTKLVEKKGNFGKVDVIPMPLEHDSPYVGEKKGTDVLRNKRVDGTVNESLENNIGNTEKGSSLKSDLSDDIIRNITYLLDNLLENYKLQNGNGKKNLLDHSVTSIPEYYPDQKLKNSYIHLRKSPPFEVKTFKPFMRGVYNFSPLYKDSKNQDLNDVTQVNSTNSLLMEINKLLPSEMFTLLNIRNRRSTNEKQSQKKLTDFNNKLFQDEISALYTIVENIKKKLVLKKIMDSNRNEYNFFNEDNLFQNVERSSEIPLEYSTSNKDYNNLQVVKYSHSGSNAKVDDILETIKNIGKELKQIDSKEKLLHEILDPETKNHNNRNKKKIKRKKIFVTVSSLKPNKTNFSNSKKKKKINKNLKEKEVKKNKYSKMELPPCCETTTVDVGHQLSIEWCCAKEDNTGKNKTNGSSTSSVTTTKELSTETSQTSVQKTKQMEKESKTSTTQNPNQAAENATSETVIAAALATFQIKTSSISSTQTTNQIKTSTSVTQTTDQIIASTSSSQATEKSKSSTKITPDEGSTTLTTQVAKNYVKKINKNHGRQVNRKHTVIKQIYI